MSYENVEYDSVVDQRIAISDDEELDYFAANEGPSDAAVAAAPSAPYAAAVHALPSAVAPGYPGGMSFISGTPVAVIFLL